MCGQSKRFLEHVVRSTFSAWSMFRLLCDHVLQRHGGLFSGLQVVWARSNTVTMTITTVTRTLDLLRSQQVERELF